MSDPTRAVNLRRSEFDVYIGRAGHGQDGYFGNPFPLSTYGLDAMNRFREYFADRLERDPEYRRRILALRGKKLGCFCKPRPCHGDVIAEWIDSQSDEVFNV